MIPRRLFISLLATGLLAAATGAGAKNPSLATTWNQSDVVIEAEGAYAGLSIDGLSSTSEPGEPTLPVRVVHFVIPRDARVEDVIVSFLKEEELPGTYRVAPAAYEVPIGETPVAAVPDPGIYGSDALFPPSRVVYLGDGFLGGYRIASVAVYPLQYAPRSGKLLLATDVSVELTLGRGADRGEPRHRLTARSDELYRTLVERLVVNPEDVAGKLGASVEVVEGVGPLGFSPRYTPSLEGSPVEYVIITSDEFESYFQELADWKTKKGVPAVVRTVSWIESNYPGGCDTAERVRMFVKDAYESWGTTYVLLGGDTDVVPIRFGWSEYYGGESVPTDLYYSDLDGNWNDDGDSKFGEAYAGFTIPGDSLDLYSDVFVGRAPVSNLVEVDTFIDKALAYEKSETAIASARDLFLAEVLFPYDWVPGMTILTDGATHVVEPALPLVPSGIRKARVYQNYVPFPASHPLNRTSAIDSLNMGYNIVSHVGHGNKDIMRVSMNNYISMQDVDALHNGIQKSGLVWMLNCNTASVEYDCIAEHFMNNPNGGAAAVFAPTRFCFPSTAKDYYYSWFDALYPDHITKAGVTCASCKIPYVAESAYDNTDRWTQLSFLLLGDPEVSIPTAKRKTLTVVHGSSVPLATDNLTVTVTDPSQVAGALVCVAKGTEVYATGHTNSSGQVTLTFTPKTTGSMTITVTADNHFPYESTISVLASAGAHVTLRSSAVDDDAVGQSNGNANGAAEAGETIELDITAGNGGQGTAVGVTATLSSTDPHVAIGDDTQYIGNIPGLSQLPVDAPFALTIADDTPNDYEVACQVTFTTASRTTWTSPLKLRVYRPILVQHENTINDGVGGNGVPDPGETITLTIELLNDGNGEADVVSGKLRHAPGEVTIADSTDTWGDIPAGTLKSGQGGFRFTVVSALTQPFELLLTDEDGKTWAHPFDLARPNAPDSLEGTVRGTTISLTWAPLTETDLWGYNVYRTDQPAGTFAEANDGVLERIAYFADANLQENHKYYYKVAGVDSSGNVSQFSTILEISTNPPSVPGWPLVGGESMYGTPAIVDVDMDGDLELVVGSGDVYCWHQNGVEYMDGDGDPRTNGVYATHGTGGYRSSLAIAEMDGDPYPEIVGAAWADVGTPGNPQYQVFAWNAEDGTVLSGWPVITKNFCWATPATGDLNGDGRAEVVLPCADGFLYCWKSDGTELRDGDNNPATTGVFARLRATWNYASPVLTDIDNDSSLEILCPSRVESLYCWNANGTKVPGWPVRLNGPIQSSPAAADVDSDGQVEIVAATNEDKVYLLSSSGQVRTGWPKTVDLRSDFPPSPSFADVDGDGDLEVVMVGSDGSINIWTYAGGSLSGWPKYMGVDSHSSAAVGDIDGTGGVEIVVGASNGKIYAYDRFGGVLPGWPIQTGDAIYCTPTLVDFDGDGETEVIVAGMDVTIYAWDCEGVYDYGDGVQWATFRHDVARTGDFSHLTPVGIPDDGGATVSELALEQNVPNPFNPVTTIGFMIPTASDVDVSVYNVSGALVATLYRGPKEPGRSVTTWNGRDATGASVASGIYFVRLTAGGATATQKVVLLK